MDVPLWLVGFIFGYSFIQFWRNCRYLSDRWEDRRIQLYWARRDQELGITVTDELTWGDVF